MPSKHPAPSWAPSPDQLYPSLPRSWRESAAVASDSFSPPPKVQGPDGKMLPPPSGTILKTKRPPKGRARPPATPKESAHLTRRARKQDVDDMTIMRTALSSAAAAGVAVPEHCEEIYRRAFRMRSRVQEAADGATWVDLAQSAILGRMTGLAADARSAIRHGMRCVRYAQTGDAPPVPPERYTNSERRTDHRDVYGIGPDYRQAIALYVATRSDLPFVDRDSSAEVMRHPLLESALPTLIASCHIAQRHGIASTSLVTRWLREGLSCIVEQFQAWRQVAKAEARLKQPARAREYAGRRDTDEANGIVPKVPATLRLKALLTSEDAATVLRLARAYATAAVRIEAYDNIPNTINRLTTIMSAAPSSTLAELARLDGATEAILASLDDDGASSSPTKLGGAYLASPSTLSAVIG